MNAREDSTTDRIKAEQYELLLKKNKELEQSLQQEIKEKNEIKLKLKQEKEALLQSLGDSTHWARINNEQKNTLEKTHDELTKVQEENTAQKRQLLKLAALQKDHDILKRDKNNLKKQFDNLNNHHDELKKTFTNLKTKYQKIQLQLNAKPPTWKTVRKYFLRAAAATSGVLLVMTGMSAATAVLGIPALVMGAAILLGGLVYGGYKAFQSCYPPSTQSDQDAGDSLPPQKPDDSLRLSGPNRRLYSTVSPANNFQMQQDPSEHGRLRRTDATRELKSIAEEPGAEDSQSLDVSNSSLRPR